MIVGLISDTHARSLRKLWQYLDKCFQGVDLILHAGDIVEPEVIEELATYAPTHAVAGNNDFWEYPHLTETLLLPIAGYQVGVTHGTGPIHSIIPRVWDMFSFDAGLGEARPDIIVHGHSHIANLTTYKGTLIVNPGSASSARDGRGESVALLHFEPEPRVEFKFFREL